MGESETHVCFVSAQTAYRIDCFVHTKGDVDLICTYNTNRLADLCQCNRAILDTHNGVSNADVRLASMVDDHRI